MYEYKAKLDWSGRHPVYDGDTVKLIIDVGFGIEVKAGNCRLYGINAPEVRGKSRELGIAARDFVRSKLGDGWFTAKTFKDKKGKYGRYLVDICLPDGDNLNKLIVENGHAEFKEY